MPSRKRASQGDDSQQLPLREKRRRTSTAVEDEHELEDSLAHVEEPIAKRGLRSNAAADVPIRLNNSGSPEIAKVQKKSHVKFGSESPPPAPIPIEDEQLEAEVEDEEDEDSDDDAPEAISHSRAEAETKAQQAEEARLLRKQEQDERAKRRKRDTEMKAQVKKSEKRQRREADEDETTTAKKTRYDLTNLPDFLPEELLATEAPERGPTPPPVPVSRVKKLTGTGKVRRKEEKAPKDVVHEGTKIRVLQTANKALPPKSKVTSKNTKSQLMQGRAALQKASKRGDSTAKMQRRSGPVAFA